MALTSADLNMKGIPVKQSSIVLFAACTALLMACAAGPTQTLPVVDVSRLQSGKVLSAAEIQAVVSGKRMTVQLQRVNGSRLQSTYAFGSDGQVFGATLNETDKGKWHVDSSTNELCISFVRWGSGCTTVSVRDGKVHMLRRANGTQYVQQ